MRRSPRLRTRVLSVICVAVLLSACDGDHPDPGSLTPVDITIPSGATFEAVVDTLQTRGLVERPGLFKLYARIKGADRKIRAGEYALLPGESWGELLDHLVSGRVTTVTMTIPEGFTLDQIAPRLAEITGLESDSVLAVLSQDSAASQWGVPGPGLEGYLFPDTYRFARGVPLDRVLETMIGEYRGVWTRGFRARLDSIGLTEREVVTLASIIEAEALRAEEMPTISSVYHNRLEQGWLLQADPTVQYALGGRRERLLYAAIDSVADHPYNTYSQPGLPPGPIGAPGQSAIEAALYPADTDFMFFVARPDGSHVFTRTLAEHNRAKAQSRQELDQLRRDNAQSQR